MNYTYCETLMWHALAPTAFRYLAKQEPGSDMAAVKRRSKQVYREMTARTSDIGSLTENPLRICLAGGMLWLSIYEAADGQMIISVKRIPDRMWSAGRQKRRSYEKQKKIILAFPAVILYRIALFATAGFVKQERHKKIYHYLTVFGLTPFSGLG